MAIGAEAINCNRLTLDLSCSFALSNISCVTLLKAFTAQGLENHEASEIEIERCPCHCPSPLPFPKPCARLCLERCATKHQLPQCCRMQKCCPFQGQLSTLGEHSRLPSPSRPRKDNVPRLPAMSRCFRWVLEWRHKNDTVETMRHEDSP